MYRHCQRGYWKASKRWCKQLPLESVNKALVRFANNDSGLLPSDVYGGAYGAIEQLQRLESWFQVRASHPHGLGVDTQSGAVCSAPAPSAPAGLQKVQNVEESVVAGHWGPGVCISIGHKGLCCMCMGMCTRDQDGAGWARQLT